MRVLEWPRFIDNPAPAAMTIGVFDGVHLGHTALIKRIIRPGLTPVIVTFKQNPKKRGENYGGDISSLDQRLGIFRRLGVEFTVLIDFSRNFSKLSGKEFIDILKDRGNLRYLVIGADFRCGYRLDTDAAGIKKMNEAGGIPTEVIPPVTRGTVPVSSSRIRSAIAAGDLREAAALLGRNFAVDLAGSPIPKKNGMFFDLASQGRVLPPPGRYRAALYEDRSTRGLQAEITVEGNGVFVPSSRGVVNVEFLPGP
jgi:riboflavin kinase/FMN adenylyltransferase